MYYSQTIHENQFKRAENLHSMQSKTHQNYQKSRELQTDVEVKVALPALLQFSSEEITNKLLGEPSPQTKHNPPNDSEVRQNESQNKSGHSFKKSTTIMEPFNGQKIKTTLTGTKSTPAAPIKIEEVGNWKLEEGEEGNEPEGAINGVIDHTKTKVIRLGGKNHSELKNFDYEDDENDENSPYLSKNFNSFRDQQYRNTHGLPYDAKLEERAEKALRDRNSIDRMNTYFDETTYLNKLDRQLIEEIKLKKERFLNEKEGRRLRNLAMFSEIEKVVLVEKCKELLDRNNFLEDLVDRLSRDNKELRDKSIRMVQQIDRLEKNGTSLPFGKEQEFNLIGRDTDELLKRRFDSEMGKEIFSKKIENYKEQIEKLEREKLQLEQINRSLQSQVENRATSIVVPLTATTNQIQNETNNDQFKNNTAMMNHQNQISNPFNVFNGPNVPMATTQGLPLTQTQSVNPTSVPLSQDNRQLFQTQSSSLSMTKQSNQLKAKDFRASEVF